MACKCANILADAVIFQRTKRAKIYTFRYCKAIDFLSGMTQEDLEEQVLALVHAEGWTKTVLLTDIVGGTPFKAAVKLSLEDPEIRVIAGINLPVLLQLAVDADQAVDIDGCIEQAVEEGRFCLKKVDLSKFRTC